jgi:biopolymer transport protein ExbB/TolQ
MLQLLASAGFIGPLLVLAALAGLIMFLRRHRALRMTTLAPPALSKSLEPLLAKREIDRALDVAAGNGSLLGQIVEAALLVGTAGPDEMLANLERVAARESLNGGNRVAHLARLGVLAVLIGLFGTTISLISASIALRAMKAPTLSDLAGAIGESLVCAALGLLVALLLFTGFYFLDHRLARRSLATIAIAEDLLRPLIRAERR